MITPQELRIGNWVNIEGNPYPILAINPLNKYDIYEGTVSIPEYTKDRKFIIGDVGKWVYKLEPIPLTPEILEKCGFEKDGEIHYTLDVSDKVNGIIELNIYTGDGEGKYLFQQTVGMGYYMGINIPVQSLHQLQNLYYFFTSGKELNVQL